MIFKRGPDRAVRMARRAFEAAWDCSVQADEDEREIAAMRRRLDDILARSKQSMAELDARSASVAEARASADRLMAEAWRLYNLLPPSDQRRIKTG